MAEFPNNKLFAKCKDLQVLKSMLFSLILLCFLFSLARAERTVKTIEYPLDHIAQPAANTNYFKNITIVSPDGISEILSFEIFMQGDFQANTDVKFRVRNINGTVFDCEPNTWTTPNLDSPGYFLSFDCTSLVNQFNWSGGKIEIGFRLDKVAQNVKPRIQITYFNNPKGSIAVWGTEYQFGQDGTIWVQLKDENGEAENDGACYIDVWYPNLPNATHPMWLNNTPMLLLPDSDGLYYYDFNIPEDIEGVYMMSARCSYIYESEWYYNTLEDEPNRTIIYGIYTGDPVVLNLFNDYEYTKCDSAPANKRCKAEYVWIVDDANITSLDVFWMGETDNDVLMEFYVYNWTSDEYIMLSNSRETDGTGYNNPIGVNELISNSIPLNGTISGSNEVKVLVNSSAIAVFKLFNNWLTLRASQEGDFVTDIKGSGEIHVSTTNVTGSVVGNFLGNITGNILGNVSVIDPDQLKYAGGTEYLSGTEGQVTFQFITVAVGNQIPVNDADSCNATIWFPNSTVYIENLTLSYLTGSNGLYYSNFTIPSVDGVYKVDAVCYKIPKFVYSSASFHVEDTLANNQQQLYSFMQAMNTTMVSNQNYIISLVQNVSIQIDNKWDDFWGTATARIVS